MSSDINIITNNSSGQSPASQGTESMPVLHIITSDSEGTDFATKPVNRSVAESIAAWMPNYTIPPEPYYVDCSVTLSADVGGISEPAKGKVKVRGNWTTTYDKKSLRIKFEEKQNLLGLNNGESMKNWLLLAEFKDDSLLRTKSALSMSEEILGEDGLYASDCEFVEVYINDEYWGVYLLAEYQQVQKNRVAIAETKPGYQGTDIGYFLEFDGYFYQEDDLHKFHVDYADNAPLVSFDGNGGSGQTMADLKKVYQAINEDEALNALVEFKEKWQKTYPSCVKSWEDNWDILSTFFRISSRGSEDNIHDKYYRGSEPSIPQNHKEQTVFH